MSDTPELDQVADARRRLATHTGFPTPYWVLLGVALVLMAGLPIWMSFFPADTAWFSWGLVAIALVAAAYSVVRRHRSGVRLPRRVFSYPTARLAWVVVLAATAAAFFGIRALVLTGHTGIALAVLVPLAGVLFAGQVWIRTAMRRDIEAGRVTP